MASQTAVKIWQACRKMTRTGATHNGKLDPGWTRVQVTKSPRTYTWPPSHVCMDTEVPRHNRYEMPPSSVQGAKGGATRSTSSHPSLTTSSRKQLHCSARWDGCGSANPHDGLTRAACLSPLFRCSWGWPRADPVPAVERICDFLLALLVCPLRGRMRKAGVPRAREPRECEEVTLASK